MKFKVGDKVRLSDEGVVEFDKNYGMGASISDMFTVERYTPDPVCDIAVTYNDGRAWDGCTVLWGYSRWFVPCDTAEVEGIARIVGAKVDNIVFQRMGDDVTISVVDDDLHAKGADVITIQQLREVLRIIDAA